MTLEEIARRTAPLIDLTSLGEADSGEKVDALCEQAIRHNVAAVCVWPEFVSRCVARLDGIPRHIATVVNFPDGGTDIDSALDLTRRCVARGADEIDMVMPYRAWLLGDDATAKRMIEAVKQACGAARLKVILETGRLGGRKNIRAASRLAIDAGADFIKTSTGKTPVSATPSAAEEMLIAIGESGKPVGFKASGGIRTLRQAGNYLRLADRVMGPDWAVVDRFRFGASGLLAACTPYLGGK